jgi:hypothetical protein
MTTRIDDPNTHAPEDSPNEACVNHLAEKPSEHSEYGGASMTLPPQRPKNEFSAFRDHFLDTPDSGFYIAPLSLNPDESSAAIDIQQFKGNVVRLENAAFDPTKITRQGILTPSSQSVPEESHLHGEEHKWGRPKQHSIRWIISSGFGVAVLVVFILMMLPLINESNAAKPGSWQIGLVIDSAEKAGKIENLNQWLARRPEAMELFRVFAISRVVDDTLPLIRDSRQLQKIILKNRQKPIIPQDWFPPPSSTWIAFEVGDRICGVLEGTLPDFSKFRAYMVDSENHLVLDWKATTGHGSASFDELAAGHGDPGEIRAFISPSGYYNHVFTEADYQSYQLVSPDENRSIWCYARRGGTVYSELQNLFFEGEILKPETLAYRITARLARGPKDTLANQWVIEELLHDDWASP